MRVTQADLRDGLLAIDLVREIPEAMKPRKIDIGGGESQTLDSKAQAPVAAETAEPQTA